jgi:hypothetical protein
MILWKSSHPLAAAGEALIGGALAAVSVGVMQALVWQMPGWMTLAVGAGTTLIGVLSKPTLERLEAFSVQMRTSVPLVLGFTLQGMAVGAGAGFWGWLAFEQLA